MNEDTESNTSRSIIGCDTEADAMYAEARRRIQADITEVCEGEGFVIARLTAATQRVNRAMRTVRAYEAELCTVFGARGATDLVEQMILMTESVEKEPGESSVVTAVLETSVEVEEYKLLSKAVMTKATEMIKQSVDGHVEQGGCNQCIEGGQESHSCVKEEVSSGETKDSQETAILQGAIDATRLERGLRAKCENIWAGADGAETKCQDGSCCSREMDATDTTAQTCSGQGPGRGEGVTTEMEVARVSELGTRAMTQLEEADTDDVFKWIV